MSVFPLSKEPRPDEAEFDAFFPSPFSLAEFTSPKSNLSGADYPNPYTGTRRILVIGTDERYLKTENARLFSSGNHPIETLLPMYHLNKAGFEFDIATVSGNPVKFEFWAMPNKDETVLSFFESYAEQFQNPLKLSDVIAKLGSDSGYAGIFVPGGHGPLIGLPFSPEVGHALRWAIDAERYVIAICHGPAAFLACALDETEASPFAGYAITAFPDAIDRQIPEIGYLPGQLTWHFGDKLRAQGLSILNTKPDDSTHKDRRVLTGASPLAANALGRLAAESLLAECGGAAS